MMTVILDTNIIVADFWLRGTQFGTMLDGLRKIDGQLAIPAVVVDEVVNQFEERHGKARSKVLSSWDALNRLSEEKQDPPNIKRVDYREWLLQRLDQIGAKILPYPKIFHEKIVERELSRKRPFRKGNGYRDYLIWETVLKRNGVVMFVTENTADFADGDNIHPDLAEDLRRTDYARDRFHILWSLRAFNEEFILSQLEQFEEVRRRLEAEGPGSVDLHAWIRENLDSFLVEEDLLVAGMNLPPEAGSAGLLKLSAPPQVTIYKVWEREPGRYLVKATAWVPVSYFVSFNSLDYANYPEVRELIEDYLGPGSSESWTEKTPFYVDFVFTLGGDPPRILDWDIEKVQSGFC